MNYFPQNKSGLPSFKAQPRPPLPSFTPISLIHFVLNLLNAISQQNTYHSQSPTETSCSRIPSSRGFLRESKASGIRQRQRNDLQRLLITAKLSNKPSEIPALPSQPQLPSIDSPLLAPPPSLRRFIHFRQDNAEIGILQEFAIIISDQMKSGPVEVSAPRAAKSVPISRNKWRRLFVSRATRKMSDLSRVTDCGSSMEEQVSLEPQANTFALQALDYFDFSYVE